MKVQVLKGGSVVEVVDNAFCPTGKGGGVDPTCGSGGGDKGGNGLSSKGMKIEDDPGNWAGKYKVGENNFASKKDAKQFIKDVKDLEKKNDIGFSEFVDMDRRLQNIWGRIHLDGYDKSSIEDRNKMMADFRTDLLIAKSKADSLRPDGSEKNVFDYWAESAKEWEALRR